MALVLNDRVRETTSVVGTGAVTLLGAVTGFQSFSTIGDANTTYYCISDQAGANWEVGIGTYTSAGTLLARTTVLASSNAGALVSFTGGTKDVFVTYPSSKGLWKDASGNVGIGTSSPLVVTNQTSVNVNGTSASRYELLVGGTRTSYVYTDALSMQIGSITAIPVQFTTAGTEKMRIDSSGNVGIGTTAGTSKLYVTTSSTTAYGLISQTPTVGQVAGDSVNMAYITNSRGVYNDGLRFINYRDSTGSGIGNWQTESYAIERNIDNVAAQSSVRFGCSYLRLDTAGVERLRIDASGNVGIGTSGPAQKLHIASDGYNFRMSNGDNSFGYNLGRNVGDGLLYFYGNQSGNTGYVFSGANGERMRIDSSGNVGIGTSSPSSKLDVVGSVAASTGFYMPINQAIISSRATDGAAVSMLRMLTATNTTVLTGGYGAVASTTLSFQNIAGTELMVIQGSGNVGIGLTSPTGKLDVAGTIKTLGYTVASLPTGVVGARAYVTNALAPVYGSTVVTGGAVTIPVFYNGTNWIVG